MVAVLFSACGPEGEHVVTLEALGLHLTENPYALKPGALVRANDTTIERAGVVQLRRGLVDVGMTALVGEQAKAGTFFQDKLVFQHGTSALSYLDGSTRTAYTGTFTPPINRRTRFAQANQNLYFSTSTGVQKLTAYNATPSSAGGPRPLHLNVSVTGTSGFLAGLRSTAYRVVWSQKDANGNVVTGPPSQYETVTNTAVATSVSGQATRAGSTVTVNTSAAHGLTTGETVYMSSADVLFPSGDYEVTVTDTDTFTFTQTGTAGSSTTAISFAYTGRNASVTAYIPPEVTATSQGYYAEVFRAYDQTPDALSVPSDEMGKVYEYYPTNVDITNGYFTFTDSTTDGLVGNGLYTNAGEEGLTQANDPPPVASDLAHWGGHMFYADSTPRASASFAFLSTTGLSGASIYLSTDVSGGSTAYIGDTSFTVATSGTATENTAATARNFVASVNTNPGFSGVTAAYISGPYDPPGIVLLVARDATAQSINASLRALNGSQFAPALGTQFRAGMSRTGSTVTVTTTNEAAAPVAHGFVAGQSVLITGIADFSDGAKTIATVPTSSTFTYTEAGAATTGTTTVYSRVNQVDLVASVAGTNRFYYSKYGEPEHVPALNYIDIGAADDTIRRIVPLRDSLFIFMEKGGLYRLSGEAPFFVDRFDETVRLLGDENLAVLDNKILALTHKGVVAISESGVGQAASYPIETALLDLQASSLSAVKSYGFAVAYESARKFALWLPDSADDTNATQAYVFHLDTGTWTRWTKSGYFGLVHPTEDLLYLSRGTTISKERKSRSNTDYQDEGGAAITGDIQWAPFSAGDPGTMKQFQEVQFLLTGATVTGLTAYFSTDQSTTETAVPITGTYSKGAVRCLVPLEKARGGELNVRLVHATAGENLSVAGMKILYRDAGSPAVNR